ncbi:MAG: hypothetical protein L3K11_01305 [Thermoplasmata archaeon]|nr:hypothetical protein [Thermoplasmata archaeon]
MKRIHVWPNHVAVRDLDLVLPRSPAEPLRVTLSRLARMGFNTDAHSVELHPGVAAE